VKANAQQKEIDRLKKENKELIEQNRQLREKAAEEIKKETSKDKKSQKSKREGASEVVDDELRALQIAI